MSPRPRSVSDAEVLAGVGRVVGREGPVRLTLASVAEEVGLAPPTLLQRFGSKRGLLLAFARHAAADAGRELDEARARLASPLAALVDGLAAMARGVETPEAMANHLAFLQMDLGDPDLHRHALAHARTVRERIEALLREGVAAGEVAEGDPAELARAVHAVYNGALVGWAVEGDGSVERYLRGCLEAVLAPLRREGTR